MDQLKTKILSLEGKGYKAYKSLKGEYRFPRYRLIIDHVQGDPFAAPSRIRVKVAREISGFPENTTSSPSRTTALCDHLTRAFYSRCQKHARGDRGIGKSGVITMDRPVQEVLKRTSMVIDHGYVEARFVMGLPARGRRIAAGELVAMIFQELPLIVHNAMFMESLDTALLYRALETVEDADFLRCSLGERGLVGFVADNALLPRQSGIDPRPLNDETAVLFASPEPFRVSFHLPNHGVITGMGIPKGVTLLVGGGYHGKSTLLNAMELGVYNHVPGDGREFVVTLPSAVKIRAADKRSITGVDISPFINNLPMTRETTSFSTANASGSTSQAANISEALEAGAKLLLLDEDTSATNFMIRDHRMQQLVSKEMEPITPFIDKVRQLYTQRDVSTILVMGGSGDYFSKADHVICMAEYLPRDATGEAKKIAQADATLRLNEGGDRFGDIKPRVPKQETFDPKRRSRDKISAPRTREILFGNTLIDMWDVEQLVDISQTRAIGYAIKAAVQFMDGSRTLKEVAECLADTVNEKGLESLTPYLTGDLAQFRSFEFIFAVNRMRTLKVNQL